MESIKTIIFDLGNVIVAFDHHRIFEVLGLEAPGKTERLLKEVLDSPILMEYQIGRVSTG